MAKLLILAGIDGSGKSTILESLKDNNFKISHWKLLRFVKEAKMLNFTNPAQELQSLNGIKRYRYIFNYINAEKRYLIDPWIKKDTDVISDGLFVKFYTKELVYKKLNLGFFRKMCPLEGEEIFAFIDTPPEVAYERKTKKDISCYEYLSTPRDFIMFQTQVRDKILDFIQKYKFYLIDGTRSKGSILKNIEDILAKEDIRKINELS